MNTRKLVRRLSGVALLILGVMMIFAKALIKFPIGLYTTITLLSADGAEGNTGAVLGRLTGDFVAFALCILFLYMGAKLLRTPKIKT